MKKDIRILLGVVLLASTLTAQAQQVTTLYFLENAPMRHLVNPAFLPVSNGYLNLPVISYTSFWAGNNSLTMSDLIYRDPLTGNTITALHPNGDKQALLKAFRKATLVDGNISTELFGFGFRVKENGYFHFNIMERVDAGVSLPYGLFNFALGGGMKDLDGGINTIDLSQLGITANVYTEVGFGYAHKINEQWTVGGKAKFLLGTAYIGLKTKNLGIDASSIEWRIHGNADVYMAGPADWGTQPDQINKDNYEDIDYDKLVDTDVATETLIKTMLKPSGYGASFDLGFTYKPIEQLQISAAITDLGFIYWNTARRYSAAIDTTFTGAGDFEYDDYVYDGEFNTDSLMADVKDNLYGIVEGSTLDRKSNGFARMLSAKLNVGVDANFWDNRVGVGVVSNTRLYNSRLYEEVTLGAALRPCNWFNVAVSYSLVNNGKYSNIGAGLSIMPYDGINLTLAMDYIPTSYAYYDVEDNGTTHSYPVPYKAKGVNLALGLNIVWGTNKKKDSDKDGVYDKIDMCPNTPKNVAVDALGCPIDSDGDGVPDYLDLCPGTSEKAYGLIDSVGCPIDSDGDGVPDYLDECPDTPAEARGFVDEKGCEIDTDGDGVPDWKDECPTVAGPKYNKGCPEVKREVRNLLKKAMQGIQFENGKATIKKSSNALLDQIAQTFIDNPTFIVEVQGHTDNVGKAEFNKTLSDKRAHAVMDYLIKKGVPAERLSAHGYGMEVPIADNKTAKGRAQNRRVEFNITFEEITYETILDHADSTLLQQVDTLSAIPTDSVQSK